MTLDKSTISPTGATLEISNNREDDIYVGNNYSVQKKTNNEWTKLDGNMDFFMDAKILPSGESLSFSLDWSEYYGELPDGDYRIEKVVLLTSGESILLYCEFSI